MNYQKILKEIACEIEPLFDEGKVADYIPALKNVNSNDFAMTIELLDGRKFSVGCCDKKFSIQSISKVFTYSLALGIYEKSLYKRVWHEPSGDPFNSLVQLEYENGIPRNPFINAGAIVTVDALISKYKSANNAFMQIQNFISEISGSNISINEEVYHSELEHGFRNMSLINLMKSFDNIENEINSVMQTYFKQCSFEMNTNELARAMLYLANHGTHPITHKKYLNKSKAKRINSLMLTCGHYDASGDFAFRVGLPGKSGVGGGIVAIVPRLMSLCVYSPKLNAQGNSLVGTKALELFTTKTGLSIF